MFRATFGSKPVFSNITELATLLQGSTVPPEFSRCISLYNPAGFDPARGWLLMQRSDLTASDFDINATHDLVFEYEDERTNTKNSLTFNNLVICREPANLTTGVTANDPLSVFLVEVADARWRVHNPYRQVACNKIYNVSSNASGGSGGPTAYLASSLNSGTPWTWAGMIGDIWSLMTPLGSFPGLPVTPDGTPVGWIFQGTSAWAALNSLLTRIGCMVVTDLDGTYEIVQIGAADTTNDATLAMADKIMDGEYLPVTFAPRGVRVCFHKMLSAPTEIPPWLQNSVYTVDIAGSNVTTENAGIYHPVWDDMPALYNGSGTLTNTAALATRAQERADDYFRMLDNGGSRSWKRYSGLLDISSGSTIKAITWRLGMPGEGDSTGVTTEIMRHPFGLIAGPACDYADAGTVQDLVRLGFPTGDTDIPKTHICLTDCDGVEYCVAIPTADIVLGNCDDTGSGGGGEFIPVDCDCGPVSSMLCATVSGMGGGTSLGMDCSCLEGVAFDLEWDAASTEWRQFRTDLTSCAPVVFASLGCSSGSTWIFRLAFLETITGPPVPNGLETNFSGGGNTVACDPFHLSGILVATEGACTGTVDIVIGPCGSTSGIIITDLGNNKTSTTPTTTLSLTGKTVTQTSILNVVLLDAAGHTATATFNGSPLAEATNELIAGVGRLYTFINGVNGTGDYVVTVSGGASSVILMSAAAISDLDSGGLGSGVDPLVGATGAATVPDTGPTGSTIYPKVYAHGVFLTEDSGTITFTNGFTALASAPTITLGGRVYVLSQGYKVLSTYQTVDAALTNSAAKWAGGVLTFQ